MTPIERQMLELAVLELGHLVALLKQGRQARELAALRSLREAVEARSALRGMAS